MKIAFDVKGTLDGSNKELVLKFFHAMKNAGHQVEVWSNSIMYASECVRENNLDVSYSWKDAKSDVDYDESKYFDLAVEDDTRQTYLATKEFLWVHEINESNIDELIKKYGG